MSKGNRTRRKAAGLLPTGRLCTAHRKNGDPCKRPPIKGGTVCMSHGGASPAVRRKAQERLMAGVLPLLAQLYKLATDEQVPPAVRLAAIKDWLDRAGLNATTVVELELPWQQLLTGIVASVDDDAPGVRHFFQPGELDRSSPTILTEGVDYAVSDRDYGYAARPGSPAEAVDYGQAPRHDPAYPPEPRAGQRPDRPRQSRTRRGRRR